MTKRTRLALFVSVLVLVRVAIVSEPQRLAATTTGSQGSPALQMLSFSPSDANFPNPERGVHVTFNPFFVGTQRTPLDERALKALRERGITLVHTYFIIDEFRDGPLSREALDAIGADFATARRAGVKLIPRFAYVFPCVGETEPCRLGPGVAANYPDAPLQRVLDHIDQLTPMLRANADVIAFLDAGFVGAWGEWHTTSNRLVNDNGTTNASSAAIVERLLWALPENRMIALRYPYHKQQLYGAAPLLASEAFTASARARIGHHNDCFLSNIHDSGTYAVPGQVFPPTPEALDRIKTFLSLDNRFVPQGGETCSSAPAAQPYIGCPNALADLERLHWTTANRDFQPEVIQLWKQQGCYGDIEKRLGYRFRLVEADIPGVITIDQPFTVQFTIVNDGWAAPYNPRAALVGLRHASTGRLFTIHVADDPRRWGAGETHTVSVSGTTPTDADPGEYQVLLNFPDPEPTLWSRPEYAIRLANEGLWEPSTGSNVLPGRITITK